MPRGAPVDSIGGPVLRSVPSAHESLAHLPIAPAWWSAQRFPWALAIALLLVASVEVWLHLSGWPKRVPWSSGQDEYYVVAAELDRHGAAEVAIIGSSRTRESIHMPALRKEVRKITGREVWIANYAESGARAYDFAAHVRRLLRDKHPPKVIVIGLSERDLGDDGSKFDQAPQFWNLSDWKREEQRRGFRAVADDLPTVLRNYIGRVYWTLRYRDVIRIRLRQLFLGQKDEPMQIQGDLTSWQRYNPDRNLRNRKAPEAVVKKYARSLARGRYPNRDLATALDELAAECKAANVRLIFYEIPVPQVLRGYVDPDVYTRFHKEVQRVCSENGARFIKAGGLHIKYTDSDFREPSHMNAGGARRLSTALGKRVLGPELLNLPKPKSSTTGPTSKPSNATARHKPKR